MSGDTTDPFSAAPPLEDLRGGVEKQDLLRLADDEAEVQTGEQIELSLAAMAVIEI
jgi:hypothetical protein